MSDPDRRSYAFVWDGVLLFAPREISNTKHAHFAATVLLSVDAPFSLDVEGYGRRRYEGAVLAPNVARELDSEGHRLVDFLVDPDDPAYRFLHPLLGAEPLVALPGAALTALRPRFETIFAGGLDCAGAAALVDDTLAALCPEPAPALPWDPRVRRAAEYMRARVPDATPTVPEVAGEVGLSASRFMHLFRAELGLPVRRYLLWLRIRHAMRLWAEGQPLSEIALGAGFYDQAHFTRTLRRMTDYAPSMLLDPRSVVRRACARNGRREES